jgi:hypothetical protein
MHEPEFISISPDRKVTISTTTNSPLYPCRLHRADFDLIMLRRLALDPEFISVDATVEVWNSRLSVSGFDSDPMDLGQMLSEQRPKPAITDGHGLLSFQKWCHTLDTYVVGGSPSQVLFSWF